MKRLSLISLTLSLVIGASMLFCINLPESPAENPKYADIELSISNVMLHQGDVPQIGVAVYFTQHFHTVTLRTSCNVFDTLFSTGSLEEYDTLYFSPQFDITGPCTVFVDAQFKDSGLRDKCDTLPLYILAKETGVYFITNQTPVTTVTGKSDTLLYVTRASSGTILPPEYKITALPSTGITLTPLYSQQKDTVRVVSVASVADTFTVMIVASALYGNSFVEDSAFTGMRVNIPGMLLPSIVSIPDTIPVGTADTLIFTVDNNNSTDTLTIKHTTRMPLDSAVFSVLPTGTDSVLIHVKPSQACTADVGIIVFNSTRSDTSWYQVKLGIVDTIDTSDTLDTLLWNKSEIAITAIEGKPLKYDIRQYLIKPQTGSVIFNSDIGTVIDTTWEWTPPYGTIAATSATISATNGVTISPIILTISITPSDTTKPELSLVDTVVDGKKISAPEFTVNCIAKDSEAGVDSISITCGSTMTLAVLQLDGTYSGVVSGLENGKPTEITVTAIDKSMRKNSRILKFTVTYDSTMLDVEPPVIAYFSGPQNGERVTIPHGTITYVITDNSGVDSVWWTLNGTAAGCSTKGTDGKYTIVYTLETFGNNTIAIHARDAATNRNSRKAETSLIYNITPVAISAPTPPNNATDIPTQPTFTWEGGTDNDGDTVFYVVSYDKEQNSMTIKTPEVKANSVTLPAENKLDADTKYFWKVIGYTKTPYADTVISAISSFTTSGLIPTITKFPESITKCTGEPASFTVEAAGTGTLSYQWKKDGTNIPGATSASYKINTVFITDTGKYTCFVNNGVGSGITSEAATLTVNTEPTITTHPASITTCIGEAVLFQVIANGATIAYQWKKEDTTIAGATSATYSIASVTGGDAGNYSCLVTNGCGNGVISTTAMLTVNTKPSITVNPVSQTKWAGDTVIFTIAATGSGTLNYQWKKNGNNVGTNSSSLVAGKINYSFDNGATFTCDVTNSCGTVTSQGAILTVNAGKTLCESSNADFTFVTLQDNTLWGWGNNGSGQLGIGTSLPQYTPVHITSDVASMDAGSNHSLIKKNDGTLWACGWNLGGVFGNESEEDSKSFVQVSNITNIANIDAGANFSLFLKTDGTAYGCGNNGLGQLGLGETGATINPEPIYRPGGIATVAAGGHHTLLLMTDRKVLVCGNNRYGQLGIGTAWNEQRTTVYCDINSVKSIAAGYINSMFIKTDNTLWGCGDNSEGQLGQGIGADTYYPTPVQIVTDVKKVSIGGVHTLIIKTDNTLWACGGNNYGELGDGSTETQRTPIKIMDDVANAAAGSSFSIVIKTDGSIWVFGINRNGELGLGSSVTQQLSPVQLKW
ncbi:MAG: immunoglobulin domain-containing protein [Chitinispirillaceae bacterium]|nr:immunoglobulin domain-containing protein [Chitinispirillaceae bacterium]